METEGAVEDFYLGRGAREHEGVEEGAVPEGEGCGGDADRLEGGVGCEADGVAVTQSVGAAGEEEVVVDYVGVVVVGRWGLGESGWEGRGGDGDGDGFGGGEWRR